ncbi:MAG TPA: trigger factor [Thermodesulfobacteriota bacterium]
MSAKVQVESLSPIRRRFSVEVPKDRVDAAIDRAYEGLRKEVRLKGFRQGKVPRPILERYYKERVEQEVASRLIQDSLSAAVTEHRVTPVATPVIEQASLEQGKDFAYTAILEVKPEVQARDYVGLPMPDTTVTPDEGEIQSRLERLREVHAQLRTPAEPRPARKGDTLTVDFEGEVDGAKRPDMTGTDVQVELGSDRFIPGFEEALEGVSVGETKSFTLTFPEDYREPSLSGKSAGFTVTVKDLKEKVLPALDDEFAKDVGSFDSLEALRAAIRDAYVAEETERRQAAAREALLDALLERNPVEIPPALVEDQARALIREWQHRMQHQGLDLSRVRVDPERLAAEARERARRQVHAGLVLEAVARQEGLAVDDGELDARIARLAEGGKQTPESLRRRLEASGRLEDLRASLLEEKTLEFLVARAGAR